MKEFAYIHDERQNPSPLRAVADSQLGEYNLVQREADGRERARTSANRRGGARRGRVRGRDRAGKSAKTRENAFLPQARQPSAELLRWSALSTSISFVRASHRAVRRRRRVVAGRALGRVAARAAQSARSRRRRGAGGGADGQRAWRCRCERARVGTRRNASCNAVAAAASYMCRKSRDKHILWAHS